MYDLITLTLFSSSEEESLRVAILKTTSSETLVRINSSVQSSSMQHIDCVVAAVTAHI